MGRRKFLFRKCLAECGEKGEAIIVASLGPRFPHEVTVCVCVCVCVCVFGVYTYSKTTNLPVVSEIQILRFSLL